MSVIITGVFLNIIDKKVFKLNRVISPETKYIHITEAIQEADFMFLLASLKSETFTYC